MLQMAASYEQPVRRDAMKIDLSAPPHVQRCYRLSMAFTTVWKQLCILIAPAPRMCCRESEGCDRIQHMGKHYHRMYQSKVYSTLLLASTATIFVDYYHQSSFTTCCNFSSGFVYGTLSVHNRSTGPMEGGL